IANRGEIAIRIARSAKDLGIKTIGIYSEDDVNSLHLSKMDDNYLLNGKGASAYLDTKKIVSLAKECKADAIHPGYGFLSENAGLARESKKNGISFIGPEEKTLRLLGNKIKTKEVALKENVPVIKGTKQKTSLKEAEKFFKSLKKGSAIIIKAVAGGGGIGMRVVYSPKDLKDSIKRASSEAYKAFGSSDLYVEEYLKNCRHVEIQIIGDGKNSVSHLWDRECTVQRRFQKILEVAPSPSL
ncbi:uncharacterized protein METZ01_LOCUS482451, partial [marine metagenome]